MCVSDGDPKIRASVGWSVSVSSSLKSVRTRLHVQASHMFRFHLSDVTSYVVTRGRPVTPDLRVACVCVCVCVCVCGEKGYFIAPL